MNLFFDTNVLMDNLLGRQPYVTESQRVWILAERGKVRGVISVLSFPNIFYIVGKTRGKEDAARMLRILRGIFHVVACDEQILQQAMDADFLDFEDAIQYFSALRADSDFIISRNAHHFPHSTLPVLSPNEFLSTHPFE